MRRRRLSRRRFRRRVAWGVFLVGLLLIGTAPALHSLGYLSPTRDARTTTTWEVVRIAPDRRAVVIRVDECRGDYVRAKVSRVGANARLTVFVRADSDEQFGVPPCGAFSSMPTHTVHLGFPLPATGHVVGSNCPTRECHDIGA